MQTTYFIKLAQQVSLSSTKEHLTSNQNCTVFDTLGSHGACPFRPKPVRRGRIRFGECLNSFDIYFIFVSFCRFSLSGPDTTCGQKVAGYEAAVSKGGAKFFGCCIVDAIQVCKFSSPLCRLSLRASTSEQ